MVKRALAYSPLLVWAFVGIVLALLSRLLYEHLWIWGHAPFLIWLTVGLILITVWFIRALRSTDRSVELRLAALRLAVTLAIVLATAPLGRVGAWLTMHARFAFHRSDYDAIVAEVHGQSPLKPGPVREHVAIVNHGPPLRIAFVWPGSLLDNWCGAVYDPSGKVMMANLFTGAWEDWEDQVPTQIIKLFGGDLVSCVELSPPYYHCCFT